MKDDLIDRASAYAASAAEGDPGAALITELLAALDEQQGDAVRALWSVVKAQGGYARVPKLFVHAMTAGDKLDVQLEGGGEAVIYKALSAANAPTRGAIS